MSSDSQQALFQAETGAPELGGTKPSLKTWVTPKVITGEIEETQHGGAVSSDASVNS